MSIQYYYGQNAVRYILEQHQGKATIEQIRQDMKQLVAQGIASDSMTDAPLNRALQNMVKWQEVRKITTKGGRLQYYELQS